MDKTSIILQGIDICVNQIDYIEFGLKQSEHTTYLMSSVNIINHLLERIEDIELEKLIPLFNKIDIDYGY